MELEEVSIKFLREITDGFSKERILGEGAFGVVYKGVTKNGEDVAVKKLKLSAHNVDCQQFRNEFYNLRKLKHQNIVQVLGYCYETEKETYSMPDGSKVPVEKIHAALCFEYLSNGSLQKHLSDEQLDWHKRFKIIKGTCEGLKYIHRDLEEPMYHLDLKPHNILLDKDMVPKIADFGLSRIISKELPQNTQSRLGIIPGYQPSENIDRGDFGLFRTHGKELPQNTQSRLGTLGYQPPEHIDRGEFSDKFDIFSLGVVMIQIVSGPKGYSDCQNMSSDEFVDQVQKIWRNKLQATCSSDLLEAYCHQVETCTHIALNCMERDSQERPSIVKITEKLNEIEINIHKLPQKEMRKEPKDIPSGHPNIKSGTDHSCSNLEVIDARETSSNVVEKFIVGRTEEKEKIMASLLKGMSKKIVILPIYGIGGIGKTTFARMIYNDPKFNGYSRVWVHVSQSFGLHKILDSIISQLPGRKSQADESQLSKKVSCLTKQLYDKKIMICLDDLWEDGPLNLEELKDMIKCHDNSKIIILVTTRSKRVAEIMCTNLQPYKILPLTNDMCWDIIKQRSGFEDRDDKEHLMDIGQEIAQKCCGVALAALSLGFTLRSMKNFDHWMKVKDSDIWKESVSKDFSLPNHVLASLKLSYSYMSLCLKQCFTYCAMFPKGHNIVKHDLIYQWISLDLIKPTKLLSSMEICEKYIVQLLGLSFFQQSMSPETSEVYYEQATFFTMHDLVHDLAISLWQSNS